MIVMNYKEKLASRLHQHEKDPDYHFEGLQFDVMEQMLEIMEQKNVSNSQMAKKLKCSSAYITKLLKGDQNLTIRKLFDIGWALGQKLEVKYKPMKTTVYDIPNIYDIGNQFISRKLTDVTYASGGELIVIDLKTPNVPTSDMGDILIYDKNKLQELSKAI